MHGQSRAVIFTRRHREHWDKKGMGRSWGSSRNTEDLRGKLEIWTWELGWYCTWEQKLRLIAWDWGQSRQGKTQKIQAKIDPRSPSWVEATWGRSNQTETLLAATGTKEQKLNKNTMLNRFKKHSCDCLTEQWDSGGRAEHLKEACFLDVVAAAEALEMLLLPLTQLSTHWNTKEKWQRRCRRDVSGGRGGVQEINVPAWISQSNIVSSQSLAFLSSSTCSSVTAFTGICSFIVERIIQTCWPVIYRNAMSHNKI